MSKLIQSQQVILKDLGLYPGEIDGSWCKLSESAMAGFQHTAGFAGLKARPANQYFSPFEELPKGWTWAEDGSEIFVDENGVAEAVKAKIDADAAEAAALAQKEADDKAAADKAQADADAAALAQKEADDKAAADAAAAAAVVVEPAVVEPAPAAEPVVPGAAPLKKK
jgi:hypothetical protein